MHYYETAHYNIGDEFATTNFLILATSMLPTAIPVSCACNVLYFLLKYYNYFWRFCYV